MAKGDPAWLDTMYNPRLSVPDWPAQLSRWSRRSQQVRERQPWEERRYGPGPQEVLDLFPAQTGRGPAPVLVFLHGGYWRAMDKRDHSFLAPAFTRRGVCVVIPNYDLCPAVTVPDIVMQGVRSLAWTWRHIAAHGGDPTRIMVAGHSAGGHLAAMALACRWPSLEPDLPDALVRRGLSISGLHELGPLMRAPFLQETVRLTPEQVACASPARLPGPPGVRLECVVGGLESEEFHRQARLMQKGWGRSRVPVCESLPGLDHFSVLGTLGRPGSRLHQLAMALLRT
jgi:arylformamidase